MMTLQNGELETINPDLTREWLFDRNVVVYTVTSPTRVVIDSWVKATLETYHTWPADRPYLVVHDVSTRNAALSPYIHARVQEMVANTPDRVGRAAIVIPRNFVGTVIQNFVIFSLSDKQPRMERDIMTSRAEAIRWVSAVIR